MKDWVLIHQLLCVIGHKDDEYYEVKKLRFKNYFKFFGRDEREFELCFQLTIVQQTEKLEALKKRMLPIILEHLEYMKDDGLIKGNLNIDELENSTIKLTSKGYDLLAIFDDKKVCDFIYNNLLKDKRVITTDLLFEIVKIKLRDLLI